jgi:hypothetical protein
VSDVVVVVRLLKGEDVIAILAGEIENKLRLEYPYFLRYSSINNNLVMHPYCAYTDEVLFEIDVSRVEFVAPARQDISIKFLNMIDTIEQAATEAILEEDDALDRFESELHDKTFINGNDTKH